MRIRLSGVTKAFSGKQVIFPTDMTLERGAFTTLLGPSGCGKTTLLRMIAGLETPDSGEIAFNDQIVFSKEKHINLPPEKRGLGFVFQDFALWPHMTVFENVAFGLRAAKDTKDLDARVQEALEAVRLGEYGTRYPHQLSGGQQQRVAFARAIVIRPKCILFDEPLSALDAILREEMRAELRMLTLRLGMTSVFVTHDQIEAMSMSDSIAVMSSGHVLQMDSPEEIYAHPADPFVARFLGKSNWIDENTMVRPESMRLAPQHGDTRFDMHVTTVQYVGNGYELTLSDDTHTWHYQSAEKIAPGALTPVYISPKQIIAF